MGLGELGLYRLTRPTAAPLLVVLTLLAGFSGVAGECKVDSCLRKYQTALESLVGSAMESAHSEDPGSTEARCIALRTYLNCISNVRRGCFGNIKYHSIKNTIESKMTQRKCAAKGDIFTGAANGGGRQQPPIPTDSVCAFKGKSVYKHCGLFGDPHLRTFNHEFQTCKIRGAWPLVHNEHLTVQVTNNPVITDGSATATSMLTVMIKKNEECASDHFVTFEAQADNLPGSFYDGRTEYGPGRSVELIEVDPGKHVQIYIKYIDTTILVRQIGRYFTFAIRMPEEIVNRRSAREEDVPELCVKGCPKTEQIDYKEFLAQKDDQLREYKSRNKLAMSRDDAESLCRDAQLVDFYFDSCVFDLMTTGDNNFTKAADTALQDLLKLTPELARTNQNRTTLKKYDEQYSDAIRSRTTIFITFVCIIFSSYLL